MFIAFRRRVVPGGRATLAAGLLLMAVDTSAEEALPDPLTLEAALAFAERHGHTTVELADLAVGDLITTDTPADAPLQLEDEDQRRPATVGRVGDLRAVQIKGDQQGPG